MATIKSYTDIKQSRKLAKFLPIESADMHYRGWKRDTNDIRIANVGTASESDLPCWSLAALLGVLPKTINFGYENDSTFVLKPLENGKYLADFYEVAYVKDNPIDACVNMIIKLHELNLL